LDASESVDQVDGVAAAAQAWLRRAVGDSTVERVLGGAWAGHPLHPATISLPIGLWFASALLDTVPGNEENVNRLIRAGLLSVPVVAAAGLVDWSTLDVRQRRVGVLHALANTTASLCFLISYRHRKRGRQRAGRAWSLLGLAAVAVGGALGGHLSYALGAGMYRWSRKGQLPLTERLRPTRRRSAG